MLSNGNSFNNGGSLSSGNSASAAREGNGLEAMIWGFLSGIQRGARNV